MPGKRFSRPITSRAWRCCLGLEVIMLGVALWGAAAWAAPPRRAAPSLALGRRLRAAGRAECTFTRVANDVLAGGTVRTNGRLTLELPDRARLEFPTTGERLTLRADGGEWLQPRLGQMIVLGPARAAAARRWWQLLIDGAAPGVRVESRAARSLTLRSTDGAPPDSATVDLDAGGLPVRLALIDGESLLEYRFARWSFGRARGAGAYRQRAPQGIERVELP